MDIIPECAHGMDWRLCPTCIKQHYKEAQGSNRVVAFIALFAVTLCGLLIYLGATGKLF